MNFPTDITTQIIYYRHGTPLQNNASTLIARWYKKLNESINEFFNAPIGTPIRKGILIHVILTYSTDNNLIEYMPLMFKKIPGFRNRIPEWVNNPNNTNKRNYVNFIMNPLITAKDINYTGI